MLREKCNRLMLLIERQKAMLLEVNKCIHELSWLIIFVILPYRV